MKPSFAQVPAYSEWRGKKKETGKLANMATFGISQQGEQC